MEVAFFDIREYSLRVGLALRMSHPRLYDLDELGESILAYDLEDPVVFVQGKRPRRSSAKSEFWRRAGNAYGLEPLMHPSEDLTVLRRNGKHRFS